MVQPVLLSFSIFRALKGSKYYANMSVHYIAIFHDCKNDSFQRKKCVSFLIFAQNIDRGYTLEPPH